MVCSKEISSCEACPLARPFSPSLEAQELKKVPFLMQLSPITSYWSKYPSLFPLLTYSLLIVFYPYFWLLGKRRTMRNRPGPCSEQARRGLGQREKTFTAGREQLLKRNSSSLCSRNRRMCRKAVGVGSV